jgi:hypothetical protein
MAGQTTNYLFDYPTSTDYVKDGATAIETLADDVDATLFTALGGAYPGLRLVKKQTIGTGVSSVNVTGAFSATYENYKIIVSGGTGSTAMVLYLQCGASGADHYATHLFLTYAGATNFSSDNGSSFWTRAGYGNTNGLQMDADVYTPFAAKNTFYSATFLANATVSVSGVASGFRNNTNSYTDFTITTGGGTMTGGTIYVYGYGAS